MLFTFIVLPCATSNFAPVPGRRPGPTSHGILARATFFPIAGVKAVKRGPFIPTTRAKFDTPTSTYDDFAFYTFDHRNRLTAVTFRDGDSETDDELKRVEYKYDAFNRLR